MRSFYTRHLAARLTDPPLVAAAICFVQTPVGNTDDDFGESEEETDAVPITTESPPTSPPPTTPPPTTPPPTSPQTTLAPGTCPRNCGVPDRGGGTCRTNGRCRSCNDNRVLQGGRCYASIACKGRRIQTGSQTGATCRCLEDDCHYCNRLADGDTCTGLPSNATLLFRFLGALCAPTH